MYVDDIVITASTTDVVDTLIWDLKSAFPIKDFGQLSFFLGVEVDHTPTGLLLSQCKYIKDLLLKNNMHLAQPVSTLMASYLKLSKFDTPTFDDGTLYRSIIGGLQYLSFTRPEISFAIKKLCQFMDPPRCLIGLL